MAGLSIVIGSSILIPLSLGLYTFSSVQSQYLGTFALTIANSILCYVATDKLIPIFKEFTRKAGLFGKDIHKKGTAAGEKEM